MVAFHDTRLPEDIERGAVGGPAFFNTSNRLASGRRVVNIEWDQPLGGYEIGYGIQTLDELANVEAFFYARMGDAFAFRFKDWGDYKLARQEIGTATGGADSFQIFKTYADSVNPFDRNIYLPVNGTVSVWINGALGTEGVDYTVVYVGGKVEGTWTAGHSVEIECEFDVPVSFGRGEFAKDVQSFLNGSVPKIELQIERLT